MKEIDRLLWWPRLNEFNYRQTSPEDRRYNCVAWAVENSSKWWWPSVGYYWPPSLAPNDTIDSFAEMLKTFGFEICDNERLEFGYLKVALYTTNDGLPAHAARQLANGKWTSKLGRLEDIEHDDLHCLEGPLYGSVSVIFRKPVESKSQLSLWPGF